MSWISIDSQTQLDEFADSTAWEDVESIEYYAISHQLLDYPAEVSRTGYRHKNIHLLFSDSYHGKHPDQRFVEVALLHCELFDSHFADNPSFHGKIDSLKRVEIIVNGSVRVRCGRLIYRPVSVPGENPELYLARVLISSGGV